MAVDDRSEISFFGPLSLGRYSGNHFFVALPECRILIRQMAVYFVIYLFKELIRWTQAASGQALALHLVSTVN